jgi:hypothetical protein
MGKQQELGELKATPERVLSKADVDADADADKHDPDTIPSTRACVDDAVVVYVRREDEDVVLLNYTNTGQSGI